MKKWIERFLIGVGMVGGYALLAASALVGTVTIGYIAGQLIFLTVDDPSAWVIGVDIAVLLGLGFTFSRKRIRSGFKEFWMQLMRNL